MLMIEIMLITRGVMGRLNLVLKWFLVGMNIGWKLILP